jgi:DNA polymerase III epsilon subunit-like protein
VIIIAVDTETTGLDDTSEVVELGAVTYDTEHNIILASYSKIYKVERWSDEAAQCHHIPKACSDMMDYLDEVDPWVVLKGDMAKYVVAHKADHDYPKVTKLWPSFLKRPWLCTKEGVDHSKIVPRVASTRLGHLCVDYGIQLGGWHRALNDAEMCARIAARHDLDAAYINKMTPRYRLVCGGKYVKGIGDELKQAPSVLKDSRYYRWNTEDFPELWNKPDLLLDDLEQDAKFIRKLTRGLWKFDVLEMPPKGY